VEVPGAGWAGGWPVVEAAGCSVVTAGAALVAGASPPNHPADHPMMARTMIAAAAAAPMALPFKNLLFASVVVFMTISCVGGIVKVARQR
jgi:hypothetical protein